MCPTNQTIISLDIDQIKSAIDPRNIGFLGVLNVFETINSTNTYLLERAKTGGVSGSICFAEQQTKGRGRLGRTWFSPKGANIYCSVLWRFPAMHPDLSALSLAVAVMVMNVLKKCGLPAGVQLKWPNDVLFAGRKLAGILLESLPDQSGETAVVIGIGINVNSQLDEKGMAIPQATSVAEVMGQTIDRQHLASLLANELLAQLMVYQQSGFQPFIARWREFDCLQESAVTIQTPSDHINGVALGINEQGELILRNSLGELQRFQCGEVSIRRR